MIQVQWHGRLGNQLFQYVLGRLLSEDLGYQLVCSPLPGFPATTDEVKGQTIPNMITARGQAIDLDMIQENKGKFGVWLQGWFQRQEYYRPHQDRIRSWLNRDFSPYPFTDDDLIVHLRRTQPGIADTKIRYTISGEHLLVEEDILPYTVAIVEHCKKLDRDETTIYANYDLLPLEWYQTILSQTSFKKLYLITDCPDDPFLEYFNSYNPTLISKNEIDDFNLLRSAKKMIMSLSTFSWWAAFLSEAKDIFMPEPTYGAWGPVSPTNLIIRDDPRYHVIPAIRNNGTLF